MGMVEKEVDLLLGLKPNFKHTKKTVKRLSVLGLTIITASIVTLAAILTFITTSDTTVNIHGQYENICVNGHPIPYSETLTVDIYYGENDILQEYLFINSGTISATMTLTYEGFVTEGLTIYADAETFIVPAGGQIAVKVYYLVDPAIISETVTGTITILPQTL